MREKTRAYRNALLLEGQKFGMGIEKSIVDSHGPYLLTVYGEVIGYGPQLDLFYMLEWALAQQVQRRVDQVYHDLFDKELSENHTIGRCPSADAGTRYLDELYERSQCSGAVSEMPKTVL